MIPLALRYAPEILVLIVAGLFGFWLTNLYLDRAELREWQAAVLGELTAQTSNPDGKGRVEPARQQDAIARIRVLASNARTFEEGLSRCNQAAILYAEARDAAVAKATEAAERARQAEKAVRDLRFRLLRERIAGPGCEPSNTAKAAWNRLAQ